MITASPTEFIPRGRQAVEEHPGPLVIKCQQAASVESMLLTRMQNFNIASDNPTEQWILRGMPDGDAEQEDELYFKGHTAIWTQGLADGYEMPRVALTCETPIKFAFFCPPTFIEKKDGVTNYGVGLLDSKCLKVYFKNGEDYVTAIESPISHVWVTKLGLVLEKDPSRAEIENHTVQLPRLFSLKHPLTEMCPILIKNQTTVSYIVEADYKVIFSSPDTDLVLMFDLRTGKHFVCRLRDASTEEIQKVAATEMSYGSINATTLGTSMQGNSTQRGQSVNKNVSNIYKSLFNVSTSPYQSHLSTGSSPNRSVSSPLERLQSSLGQHSLTSQDIRKMEQIEPSKPIIPELCLETIWTDNSGSRDFNEEASTGFIHTDLIGQTYLCYLLPHTYKLNMAKMEKSHTPSTSVFGMVTNITAKGAVNLSAINMIGVLAPCGNVMLYSGPNLVGKLHIGGILSGLTNSSTISSSLTSFPRRSSLLPMALTTDSKFDDDVHLLSPVLPLHPQPLIKAGCQELRDETGKRMTLVYPGKMFRVALPPICDSSLVSNCIAALRNVLQKDFAMNLIIRWYSSRNSPGLQNVSATKEWELFRSVLSDLLGRSNGDSDSEHQVNMDGPNKRRKANGESGTDSDWNFLRQIRKNQVSRTTKSCTYRPDGILFPHFPLIHFTLHLLYEEMKLDTTLIPDLELLASFLYQLSQDFGMKPYTDHYFLDFPQLIYTQPHSAVVETKKMLNLDFYQKIPVPNLYRFICEFIQRNPGQAYPFIKNINIESKNIIQLMAMIFEREGDVVTKIVPPGCRTDLYEADGPEKLPYEEKDPLRKKILMKLIQTGHTRNSIQNLPVALHFILAQFLENCRLSPPYGCSSEAYKLLIRPELTKHAALLEDKDTDELLGQETSLSPRVPPQPDVFIKPEKKPEEDDGMDNTDTKLLRLRFPCDLRIKTVRNFLCSSTPVIIDIAQLPSVSDHEFIEEQEKQLFALCIRTMALPVGRGMFTIRTASSSCTESLSIPKLCLSGKEVQRGATVELQQIEVPPNMTTWPLFHNGVAAGLKITADSQDVDSTWIVYNKPKSNSDQSSEHAGFLMALGLNGHLKTLSFMSIYEYLVKCDEMTSVGLLLGISAANRGTQDSKTTKLLSVHIEALLPPTAVELDIPQNVQIASLMGIGLVYQGTAKRHIAEVLLQEIGRPPGPEMENHVERESYALSAGLALGLVTLGLGETSSSLRDLNVSDTLHYYMTGGNKRPLTGSQKEKYKLASFQIREGNTVNIDVTAPGATLALGLMFFRSNNQAVANWMKPPDTKYLLDFVRPDLLLLRIIARGLIMWDKIAPTTDWINSNVPASLSQVIKERPDPDEDASIEIDHEANCQAYCNIITGAAFCLGLRYAGTNDEKAINTLKKVMEFFLNVNVTWQYIGEFAGKATIESCAVMVLLSLSLVCAGSGNLSVLTIVRMMRSRIGTSHSQVTYGSHMAIHMALGFLFMGAGRFTIARTPQAIAALIISLFPKFPNHSSDNRYHLQAFRHFYVLAIEPRLFLPRDIDTGKLVLCNLYCVDIATKTPRMLKKAPCMLPELDSIEAVYVDDSSYWFVYFDRKHNWDQLIKILQSNGCIDIKQKAGCFSHLEDPYKLKTLLAETLTTEQYKTWKANPKEIKAFFNTQHMYNLAAKFALQVEPNQVDDVDNSTPDESKKIDLLMLHTYNCLKNDRMHALSIYIGISNALDKLHESQSPHQYVWQIRIISQFLDSFKHMNENEFLLSYELLSALVTTFKTVTETYQRHHKPLMRQFITTGDGNVLRNVEDPKALNEIAVSMVMNDMPLNGLSIPGNLNDVQLIIEMSRQGFSSQCIAFVREILNA